ncbi:endospore coat-associated protein YheD [Cohnella xylanilytica]|uniref:YheC/YheD family protein n=1 Tax=Cohnella xylanilytica TaxID=557555 RepID=A0A841TZQ8_9BACL|nr:YheC/YheD family protein [Cohnella xylanilytica]MBB6692438.1 YheC/YheD family protein [Cohnella xylanilytica]GIO12571.1 endospore coat-associated protein YheD [Cohnella xylanilytica]
MSLTQCNVHFTQQPERIVWFSSPLAKLLKLNGRKSVNVKLGRDTVPATVRTINRKGHHVFLSAGLRRSVRIPKTGNVFIAAAENEEIQLGPLIGILTDSGTRSSAAPFGVRTSFVKQLLQLGQKKAYFFAFTPRDINWQQETVHGWFLDGGGGWIRKVVPLPDVVYNRLSSRRAETGAAITALRDRFVKKKIPFFNWSFFNKSDVYSLLDKDPEALRHLPESVNNPAPEKIRELLEKHQFLYYKPTGGSLGNGIYRLTYHPRRGYFARYRRNGANVLLRFNNFSSLMKMLRTRHGSGLSSYVVQQGIRLIEIENCPIDFRFHMHKDGNNNWVVAGIGAKKAGRGSVTTHIKNGGSLMTPEHALGRTFGDRAQEVLADAKQVAIRLSEAIERNYAHTLGELGLDIGIDRDANVWMFEANAKPGRSIFKHPALKEQGRASLEYILDHCLYLSKFRRKEESS